MVNKLVCINLINIKTASKAKKLYIDISFNKLVLKIISLFYENGYILGYIFLTSTKIRILLKYFNDKGLLDGLCFYKKKPYFTYKALCYLYHSIYKYDYIYYISTIYGLITLQELFSKKYIIGGILYFYIKL